MKKVYKAEIYIDEPPENSEPGKRFINGVMKIRIHVGEKVFHDKIYFDPIKAKELMKLLYWDK